MKTAKKVLALLLSVLMVFTMVSSSVVAVTETVLAEKIQIEDVENKVTNAFDTVKGIIDGVHNLVGGILSMVGKECVFCDEVHTKAETDDEDTQEPTEPETPPSEPEVPVEPETPVEPVEPEEPKEDESPEDQIDNAFDSIGDLLDSIHNLVGGILAIFGKECPFCDKVHGEEDVEEDKEDETDEPDEDGCYTVTFDLNYEGAPEAEKQKVKSGDCVIVSEIPERNGYVFAAWHEQNDLKKPFDLYSTKIYRNITLVAMWVDIENKSDADLDGLSDSIEEYFGTDPNSYDTDGDGLPDDVEGDILGCDARLCDTDGDGISDDSEDADADGLNNIEEINRNTDPCNCDTDADGLNDYQEIYVFFTSPVNSDTDRDGLNDGWEIDNGTDPLVANETVSLSDSVIMGDISAEVEFELSGESAQSFTISASDEKILSGNVPGKLSEPISLTIEGDLLESGAMLRFTLPTTYPAETSEDFIPTVYYYNPIEQKLEEVPTTYKNNIAEAHLVHFSTYILLNKKAFDEVWETEIRAPGDYNQENPDCLDVVLVIDSSGSMSSNDRNALRLEAAKQFVEKLGEKDRAAIIDFDSSTRILSQFTNNKSTLYSAINKIDSSGGTSLTRGISPAIDMFVNSNYSNEAYRYIIMLTDGDGSYDNTLTKTAKENNIQIYTIGLGSGVKESKLKEIAEGTGGKYYFASKADQLIQIYEDTAMETIDYSTDSNLDGISDYYTRLIAEGKLKDGAGNRYFSGAITQEILDLYPESTKVSELIYQSIQSNDDFDGDGLKNGDELIITQSGDSVYIKMVSNPMYSNSDADPFEDNYETVLGGHLFDYDISNVDLNWLADDDLYPAALSAERYVDSAWYRFQLGLGNYVYGGEYDWQYAAQKQILETTEAYAAKLIESYKAIYISENFLTLTNDFMSEVNDILSTYETMTTPIRDSQHIRDILGYMAELTVLQKELDKLGLDELDAIVDKCEDISALYSKIDASTNKLSDIDFTEYTSLTKVSLKVPTWVTKVGDGVEKVGKVLTYITATLNTIDEICSTISGFGALTATSQSYGVMYDVLCRLSSNSDINFVSIAAGELKLSIEYQFVKLVSEAKTLIQDFVYSWDEVAIDLILIECGPIGWAISLGRSLSNLISGVGETCKRHIYMIAAGEAGRAGAYILDRSIEIKGDTYCKTGETTLDFMLLCGVLRIAGEKGMISSSDAQSWLFKWINDHDDVESFCNEQIQRVEDVLSEYGLNG